MKDSIYVASVGELIDVLQKLPRNEQVFCAGADCIVNIDGSVCIDSEGLTANDPYETTLDELMND